MTTTRQPPDLLRWNGRIDADDGPLALRWHQRIVAWGAGAPAGVALLGFACDVGVRRNQGRPGAADGPAALRTALANLAVHTRTPLYDAGDVVVPADGDDLEGGQALLADAVAELVSARQRVIVLGGGHELALGSHRGLIRALAPDAVVGIINLDAHFDLRAGAPGTSGTPFRQLADDATAAGRAFPYLALGINPDANTAALFATAAGLGARWRLDEDMTAAQLPQIRHELAAFMAGVDHVQLSLDLDVLPACVVPGVSAPAARGVGLEVIETLIADVVASRKLRVADLAELNPAFDLDQRSARTAARLAARLADAA